MELVPHIIVGTENIVQRPSDVGVSGGPICNLHGKEQLNDLCVVNVIDQKTLTGIF